MTGRDNGANTSPAIMKIASSRRMVLCRFTSPKSHRYVRIESPPTNDVVIAVAKFGDGSATDANFDRAKSLARLLDHRTRTD
jgi:hypothetical protein